MDRRQLLFLALPTLAAGRLPAAPETRQATGVRVGEVSDTSAITWMRMTTRSSRVRDGVVRRGRPAEVLPAGVPVDTLEGACPGAPGRARLRYGTREDLADAAATPWVPVRAETDFTFQVTLKGLKPDTVYHYAAETAGPEGALEHGALRGRFATAPPPDRAADITFTVLTCQGYADVDHPDGFHIYPAMQRLNPRFVVPAGDLVYYDSEDPRATTVPVARYHWHRMYSLPRHVEFHQRVPGYFMKDDHDTLADDCWPGQDVPRMRPLTFPEGVRIFREQMPVGERTYRTARWGRRLQVWFTEGRDFRSPNTMPDGPGKSVWGAEQRRWLQESLLASDAEWKVLVSPTPLVGPDRPSKKDNHANTTFQHEGMEFRRWVREHLPRNFFVICGDRHWQYHSVHPETGVHEFGCGPASDQHAGGTPGEDRRFHRFHRVKGGFLSVAVSGAGIRLRLHDVQGVVVHEHAASPAVAASSARR